MHLRFENLVSYDGCKTKQLETNTEHKFENLVSYDGCKTGITNCDNCIKVCKYCKHPEKEVMV